MNTALRSSRRKFAGAHRALLLGAMATIVAGLATVVPAEATAVAVPATTRLVWQERDLCADPGPGAARCHAVALVPRRMPVGSREATAAEPVGEPRAATAALPKALRGPAGGYSPDALAAAYRLNPNASVAAGLVVAIVDACYSPNVLQNLNAFNHKYGYPGEVTATFTLGAPPPTNATDTFRILRTKAGAGRCSADLAAGWADETALDTQAVRGLCHKCKILLVEGPDPDLLTLARAVDAAASYVWLAGSKRYRTTAISNSYGAPENFALPRSYVSHYRHPGIAVLAANGDEGWYGWDTANDGAATEGAAEIPASLGTVVGVGGTALHLRSDGTRSAERVWNSNGASNEDGKDQGARGASGGGCSRVHPAPRWQRSVAGYRGLRCGSGRSSTDIAAVADPHTGFDVHLSASLTDGGWQTAGGTSLATPLLAAMWALAGGAAGVRYPSLSLYGHFQSRAASSLYDVTGGGNGLCGSASLARCAEDWDGNPNAFYTDNVFDGAATLVDCAFPLRGAAYAQGSAGCRSRTGYDGPSGVGAPTGVSAFRAMNPAARINAPARIRDGAAATFSGRRSADPFPGGTIVKYRWYWGDGKTSGTAKVAKRHKYAKRGKYTLALRVTDVYGRVSAVKTVRITVKRALTTGHR